MQAGDRIRLMCRVGFGGRNLAEGEMIEVAGTLREIEPKPWGTDAVVDLDAPTLIGHPEHGPVAWVSTSLCNLLGANHG